MELARRPHAYLPLTVFSEADEPSQLFGYYLLDTSGFLPNVFTSIIPGINDNGVIPTGANFANGGLPTVGAVRVTLEPKPGLPTRSRRSTLVHRHVHRHLGAVRHQQRVGLVRGMDDFTTYACHLSRRRSPTAARSSER